jgi:hypothetical protein
VTTGLKLEPMQQVGTAFLVKARRALLADGMGAGKSPMTVCALEVMEDLGIQR